MVECQESRISFSSLGIVNFGICLPLSASPFLNFFVFFFFFPHFLFLMFFCLKLFLKAFSPFCNEPAKTALDYFPSFSFTQFNFHRCSFPGLRCVSGWNPSCFESLLLPGQRYLLYLPSVSSLYLCFFQLLKPFILPIPSACSLSFSYGSAWTQQAVRLISAINRFTCLATSKLLQKASSVKNSILEDWWKASHNLHLTLQCCSAAKHNHDISSFLESCFVKFCFATTCKWKEPHCTGSQGISFFLTPSSKCFRQQDRTDRLVCQSLRSVAQVVQVRALCVTFGTFSRGHRSLLSPAWSCQQLLGHPVLGPHTWAVWAEKKQDVNPDEAWLISRCTPTCRFLLEVSSNNDVGQLIPRKSCEYQ